MFVLPPSDSGYVDYLQGRYETIAERDLLARLQRVGTASYDDLLCAALSLPFISETTVKQMLARLRKGKQLEIMGLKPREHSPKRKSGIRIRLVRAV